MVFAVGLAADWLPTARQCVTVPSFRAPSFPRSSAAIIDASGSHPKTAARVASSELCIHTTSQVSIHLSRPHARPASASSCA